MVPEQSKTSYLGPFPRDCQNRGEGPENEERSERLGWAGSLDVKTAKSLKRAEPSCLEVKLFTGWWSRNSRSTDVPARIETSGQRRSEPTVKNVMTTKRRRLRSRPKGFVTKGVAVTASDHSRQGSPCTRENDEEQGQRARRLPGDRDAAVLADGDSVRGHALVQKKGSKGNAGVLRRGILPLVSQEARRPA